MSAIGNRQAIPDDRPKRALASDGVTMYAVLEARIDGRRTFYSDVDTIRLGGRKRTALPNSRGIPGPWSLTRSARR